MENTLPFGEILEAADKLPIADQESLRDILAKRIIERRRDELSQEVRDAVKEYEAGRCKTVTPDELMADSANMKSRKLFSLKQLGPTKKYTN